MADEYDDLDMSGYSAAPIEPMKISSVKKGMHVILEGNACRVVEMSTSKTGKHGHAKVRLVGIDIFTDRKYEDVRPSTSTIDTIKVKKMDYQLIDIQDGYIHALASDNSIKMVRLPDNQLGESISEQFENGKNLIITIQEACNQEGVVCCRMDSKSNE